MTFFEAMEIFMREKGMNYKELAEKSGVYPSYISSLPHKVQLGNVRHISRSFYLIR